MIYDRALLEHETGKVNVIYIDVCIEKGNERMEYLNSL